MPAPRAPLVIVNPAAAMGRASKLAARIEELLGTHAANARVIETREAGHAERLAAAAIEQGHDRVVAVGGDGTAQEVLNGLMAAGVGPGGSPPAFGLVPAGTGNDLARSLGLPLTLTEALSVALGDSTRPMDLGQASHEGETRYFSAAGGTGFDAEVAFTMGGRRARWQRGRAGYVLSTLNELRRYENRALSLRLATDAGDRQLEGRFLFVAFGNGPFYGGGMRICPDASIDDGLLDLCLAGDIGRLGALRELPGIYRGAHVNHPLVEMTRVRELRIEGEDGTRVHLDGEPFGMLPVDLAVREAAVAVAAPIG
ncbi:MAG TPA: diacylglycerol kinase family protein [Candidatus Limnocylindria bacterium]|nr:diacylglycerol kinase family protein [Candidatus Limnocylindria bacterium]